MSYLGNYRQVTQSSKYQFSDLQNGEKNAYFAGCVAILSEVMRRIIANTARLHWASRTLSALSVLTHLIFTQPQEVGTIVTNSFLYMENPNTEKLRPYLKWLSWELSSSVLKPMLFVADVEADLQIPPALAH